MTIRCRRAASKARNIRNRTRTRRLLESHQRRRVERPNRRGAGRSVRRLGDIGRWRWRNSQPRLDAVSHQPALIALCKTAEDVQRAIRAARARRLPLSVRCGGHDWAGRALCHEGLVIELSEMRHVEVEPRARAATVAGGAQAGDLIAAATPHGGGDWNGRHYRHGWTDFRRCSSPMGADPVSHFGSVLFAWRLCQLLGPNDHDRIALAYGSNIGRLRALKRRFDPDGLFTSAAPLPEDSTELPPRSYRIGSVASLS
jgi:FAD binding domain/Berberine and berberine like